MIFVRFRENLGLRFTDDGCEIHGPRGFKIKDAEGEHRNILRKLFETGLPLADHARFTPGERALLQLLSDKKVLRRYETDYSRDENWLSHYVADARESLKGLAKKKVLIVGCGGTGAIIADHLARAGVGHFVLVDGAALDLPDFNRQWTYSPRDLGKWKTDLLGEHLRTNFKAEVQTFCRFLNETDDLTELSEMAPDLIICAADKPRFVIENLVLDLAAAQNTPVLFGSVGITDDQLGNVLIGPEARHTERDRLRAEERLGIEVKIAQGSLCFTNTLAAAKIGFAAYRFLLGLSND